MTGVTASVVEPASNKSSSDLKSTNSRINKKEQEALSNILLLQGEAINEKIAESSVCWRRYSAYLNSMKRT